MQEEHRSVGASPGSVSPFDRLINVLQVRGCRVVHRGNRRAEAQCPAHDDGSPSLAVNEGGDGRVLLKCHAACAQQQVVAALGLTMADLYPSRDDAAPNISATYDYTNADGALVYQVVRFNPKGFRQRRPDGSGGWRWNLKGVTRARIGFLTSSGPRRPPRPCSSWRGRRTPTVS